MNLISDRWIPIRRADGTHERIAPWELTDRIDDNPIMAVASPRPDFDGALTQFLIGLLQTTCTPDRYTWRVWRKIPPTKDELRARFESVTYAFELEGEHAFMQDFSLADLKETWPIERLLIGSPGENAIKKGTDHFIKRNSVKSLCQCCAATALYTLQINGPAFGSGYREGMRSGGPMTTIVIGLSENSLQDEKRITLWEICWLNILDKSEHPDEIPKDCSDDKHRFPWLTKTRSSKGSPAKITTLLDVHPDQQFWPLPQRIRLAVPECNQEGICDLCGQSADNFFRNFNITHHGTLYQGFEHPLTPHRKDETSIKAIRMDASAIGYRNWLAIVFGGSDGSAKRRPARVITTFRQRFFSSDARLWIFGFDLVPGQANARCWYDATMPLLGIEEERTEELREQLERMVNAANHTGNLVMTSVIRATLLKVKDKSGSGESLHIAWKWPKDILRNLKSSPSERAEVLEGRLNASEDDVGRRIDSKMLTGPLAARQRFWEVTEIEFFSHAKEMRDAIRKDANREETCRRWLSVLKKDALLVFREYGRNGDFEVDPRRIALADFDLRRKLNSKKLRSILALP